jgi:enoyl-CoA hydratase
MHSIKKRIGVQKMYNNLVVDNKDGIEIITINRPKALNALNIETLEELDSALKKACSNCETKAVIITGSGEKAFVAGADIVQFSSLTVLEARDMALLAQRVFNYIEEIDKPVIAAVNGYALGGGCELAMACDIRIVSNKAKFGQPEVNLGIIPCFGGTQRLPRLIGKGRAKYYIYTGEMISAEEAYRIGLADKVTESEKLMEESIKIAKVIMSKAPVAVKMAKRAIDNGLNVDLKSGIAYEAEAFTTTLSTEDKTEGMKAFIEKRSPEFKGR